MYRHNIFINNGTKHIKQVYQNAIERIYLHPFLLKPAFNQIWRQTDEAKEMKPN